MIWYELISNDNDSLIKMLLSEIDEKSIKSLNDWDTCFYYGIEGILVNLVYNIIHESHIYKKEEIDTEFDRVLKPIYNNTSKLNDKQFYDIFNNIWFSEFGMIDNERKTIREFANMNQPAFMRIANTNKFMIMFTIFILAISALIGGVYSFIGMLFIIFIGLNAISSFGITKGYFLTFFLMTAFSFIGSFLVDPYEATKWNECLALSIIISISFIPVLKINLPRIEEEVKYKDLR